MHIYVFACLFVFALVSADTTDPREEIKKVLEKCQSDPATHIDDAALEKLSHGEKATHPNVAKHTLCIHVGVGVQSQNGDINLDKLREAVSRGPSDQKGLVEEIMSKCGTRTSANAEEAAIGLSECLTTTSRSYIPDHHHNH